MQPAQPAPFSVASSTRPATVLLSPPVACRRSGIGCGPPVRDRGGKPVGTYVPTVTPTPSPSLAHGRSEPHRPFLMASHQLRGHPNPTAAVRHRREWGPTTFPRKRVWGYSPGLYQSGATPTTNQFRPGMGHEGVARGGDRVGAQSGQAEPIVVTGSDRGRVGQDSVPRTDYADHPRPPTSLSTPRVGGLTWDRARGGPACPIQGSDGIYFCDPTALVARQQQEHRRSVASVLRQGLRAVDPTPAPS